MQASCDSRRIEQEYAKKEIKISSYKQFAKTVVYFTRRGQEIVILLCGGDKSTQTRDIEAAKRIAKNLEEA